MDLVTYAVVRSTCIGRFAINIVIEIGFALCMASSALFHLRLYQLNTHLRDCYPMMWKTFGTGNKELSRLAQYNVITKLSTQYRVNDPDLNDRLVTLRRLHQSGAVGVAVVAAGLLWEFLG